MFLRQETTKPNKRVIRHQAPPNVTILSNMARPKKPLEPLVPLDELKNVVKGLIVVPKDEIDNAETEYPKRKRTRGES
jgi:hypothetical protein